MYWGQVSGDAGPDIRLQTDMVLKKVQAIVEAAGSSMESVDKGTVFLTRQADFAGINEVWHSACRGATFDQRRQC
ncbi:RidA family protein [Caballeronia arationis]|uniref:RidA family protein n=1 Tax=Caballeronia arationis TaxID=1777142 RepID=UPI000788E9CE|nr:RidA family protein [Caballeronia arationis]